MPARATRCAELLDRGGFALGIQGDAHDNGHLQRIGAQAAHVPALLYRHPQRVFLATGQGRAAGGCGASLTTTKRRGQGIVDRISVCLRLCFGALRLFCWLGFRS